MTEVWWIPPLLGLGFVITGVVAFSRSWRTTAYELDAKGIVPLDANNRPTDRIEWADIVEVRSGKQGELFLYTQGRERVAKITPSHQNYSNAAPQLMEHLSPLWREITQQVYNKTFGAYFVFLLAPICIIIGVATLSQSLFPSIIMMGVGLVLGYELLQSVRRIEFTSDGIMVTKVYGRDLISAAAIRTIEVRRDGRRYTHSVLLKLKNKPSIMLDGFGLDPISLYCVVALWQRDQLNNATL